jgi:hypothetical protein
MAYDASRLPAPWAHAALGVLAVLPLVFDVPTNVNIVLTAVLTVRETAVQATNRCLATQSARRQGQRRSSTHPPRVTCMLANLTAGVRGQLAVFEA